MEKLNAQPASRFHLTRWQQGWGVVLACAHALVAGCSAGNSQACNRTSEGAVGGGSVSPADSGDDLSLFGSILRAHLAGGVLSRGNSHCHVSFEFSDFDAALFELTAWTSRSCGADAVSGDPDTLVQMHVGDGYHKLLAIDDVEFRRRAALEEARARALPELAVQAIEQAFLPRLPQEPQGASPNGSGLCAEQQKSDSGTGEVCLSVGQLMPYRFFLEKEKLASDPLLNNRLKSFVLESSSVLRVNRDRIQSNFPDLSLQQLVKEGRSRGQFGRMIGYSSVLDWIDRQCAADPQADLCVSAAGPLLELARKHMREGTTDIVTYAIDAEYWQPSKLRLTPGRDLKVRLQNEEIQRERILTEFWVQHGRALLESSDGLWLLGNGMERSGSPTQFSAGRGPGRSGYTLFPFGALVSEVSRVVATAWPAAVKLTPPPSHLAFDFHPGLSGVVLAAYGLFPLMAASDPSTTPSTVKDLPASQGEPSRDPFRIRTDAQHDSGTRIGQECSP